MWRADDSGGHLCTLLQFSSDWDNEEEVEYWYEHRLDPWGECVEELLEESECDSVEDLSESTSEDDEGHEFLHTWCDDQPH